MAYTKVASLTCDHTQAGASDSSNFTVCVHITDNNLKSVANGGLVQNSVTYNGMTVPADVIFTSDSALTTLLSWDVAYWSATTGELVAWVKLATLSHTADTVFYIGAGNAAVNTYQGGAVGTAWDSGFKAVYHLGDGSTLNLKDYSGNGNDLTNDATHPVTAAAGIIKGGATCDSSGVPGGLKLAAVFSTLTNNFRMVNWFSFAAIDANTEMGFCVGDDAGAGGYSMGRRGDGGAANNAFVVLIHGVAWKDSGATFPSANTKYFGVSERNAGTWTNYRDGVAGGTTWATAPSAPSGAFSAVGNDNNHRPLTSSSFSEPRFDIARGVDWQLAEYNNQKSGSTFLTLGSWTAIATRRRGTSMVCG